MPPALTLKHITSATFHVSPLASSTGSRSTRLLLSAFPAKPSPKYPAIPQVVVKTVAGPGSIEVTYSDKKTVVYPTDGAIKVEDLFRKIEAPARALKMKEEGR